MEFYVTVAATAAAGLMAVLAVWHAGRRDEQRPRRGRTADFTAPFGGVESYSDTGACGDSGGDSGGGDSGGGGGGD